MISPKPIAGKLQAYAPIGKCVYCGSLRYDDKYPDRLLADEHIFPHGLGGRIVLAQASCRSCEAITSSIEGSALRTVFGPLRMVMNLPTRRKKDRPESLPVELEFDGGRVVKVEIPLKFYPLRIAFHGMEPPRILSKPIDNGRKITIHYPAGIQQVERQFAEIAARFRAKGAGAALVADRAVMTLFLAKIAHCQAVAIFGLDNFFPFLPDLIRRKDAEALSMFVGCDVEKREAIEHHANRVGLRYVYRGRQKLIAIQIAPMIVYGFPSYEIIVGRFYDNVPEIPKTGEVYYSENIELPYFDG